VTKRRLRPRSQTTSRWRVVEEYERDGRQYLLACRVIGFAELSRRERQVVACACLDHSNKVVAYELGLALSTVRVLMSRAMKKYGARSRKELLTTVLQEDAAVKAIQVYSKRKPEST
jgi:DNA-binding NarL/FixJ family response regulator